MILIGNGRMITWDRANPYVEDGAVLLQGGTIQAVGDTQTLRRNHPEAEFYDAAGRLIMPGLINTHTHIYSSFARGLSLPQEKPNRNFGEILENQWWRIDKVLDLEDCKYSAYATGLESVRCGVTTLFDHHASQHHVRGSLFSIEKALRQIGLRANLCYEVSDRDGEEVAAQAIEENIDFIDYAQKQPGDVIKGMFGLHASFTLSDKTLEKCVAAMGARNAGYHVHVAEGIADLEDSQKKYGKRVVQRLYDAGILGEKTLAIHNVHIDETEMALLHQTGTMAVHNPESNMGNAVGCTPALEMLEHSVLLGLGTDAYTQDMFESLKVANLIHRHEKSDPSVGFMECIEMLFYNNARICERFFDTPLGILRPGAAADVIVLGYTPHTPLQAATLAGHVMFGLSGRCVDTSFIAGKYVMKDRVMQTLDEEDILAKARTQCADFWKRVTA
ncbi:putative aminohydrolase SsnA [Ruminococcaceae bacterium OttesenSCG-928-I18]|nr:putative aminohydrolase SsnA [Ruminococcaceae bacterium OttesenSCG-928-I18]